MIGLIAALMALSAQDTPPPILDMHIHTSSADENGPPGLPVCPGIFVRLPPREPAKPWGVQFMDVFAEPRCDEPIYGAPTDEAVLEQTLEVVRRRNIIGVLSGPPDRVLSWLEVEPHHFLPGVQLRIGRDDLSPDDYAKLFADGPFMSLGEISNQYAGIGPLDERMAPYWAMAEKADVPALIHMGYGPPGAGGLFPAYRLSHSNPALLEDILIRHPNLRIGIMHMGEPYYDEAIGVLSIYPNVFIDIGGASWSHGRAHFWRVLKMFVDAGHADRLMFGSDGMNWPGLIEPALAAIEEAPFLTDEQRRDILYNNAARFLKLDEDTIAAHHGR
ncbi:MAG: amidohydrolase family protein [Pseudomonadota bacterium]